jgi:uncharacterized protein (DUF302 family)
MNARVVLAAGFCTLAILAGSAGTLTTGILSTIIPARAQPALPAPDSGIVRVRSAYSVTETVARIKADIAAKKIHFFDEIDQGALAAEAGVKLRPSVLVEFGNPPLGTQFLTSNPYSGLDWPVRMLVVEDTDDQVWIAYTDFDYVARRHQITDRAPQFKMAAEVAASIAASAQAK